MKSFEWDVSKKMFVEVDDPAYNPEISGVIESMVAANYFAEFSSEEEDGDGATITVYATEDKNKPRFYIDIMGQNTGIATLVARDFPSLVETLHQIHPLLTLAGLDQFSTARIRDQLDRKERAKQR